MKTIEKRNVSIAALLMVVALTAAPESKAALLTANFVLAQTPTTFPLPAELPEGTTLKIDGSSSMASINQVLSDRFKAQFPAAQINLGEDSSEAALQAVLEGRADLAAIARTLTPEEEASGLVAVPIARAKVAIIVGADNPFRDTLTGEQFASIFRGEITDWSAVGGQPAPIRFIDRPATNDTRFAWPNYPVFQAAPFQPGPNTIQVAEDTLDAVIAQLGNDGISYAMVDQVSNNPAVRVLPVYGTLPDDPRYPFSQPLTYVYQGPTPTPAVQAFLAVASAPEAQAAIAAARTSGANTAADSPSAAPITSEPNPSVTGVPSTTASPEGAASTPGEALNSPEAVAEDPSAAETITPRWWWLLPILAILGLLAWIFRERKPESAPVTTSAIDERAATGAPLVGAAAADASMQSGHIVLTPYNCTEVHASWEISVDDKALLRQQGGKDLALRLYDVTNIDLDYQAPHSLHEFKCSEEGQELQLPVPLDDRDYVVEIGYVTAENQWLPLARSAPTRVPACEPSSTTPTENQPVAQWGSSAQVNALGASAVGASTVEANAVDTIPSQTLPTARPQSTLEGRLFLVPRSAEEIYAYWEVTDAHKEAVRQQGGERLVLRVYDITGVDLSDQPPRGVQQFECDENISDRRVTVPTYGDYIGTLGYLTREGRWLLMARSSPVRIRAANASVSPNPSNPVQ
jgi:phosphate transport system substrate-binding protein